MTASGRKIRIAEHIEIEWLETGAVAALCPNCEATVQARRLLDIDYRPPDARHRFILQICPECTVRFVDNAETMDYGTELLIEMGWNIYQVQLGAGVWPISAPLTRVAKPAGAKALEIGGAFGFGLDFGVRARGWAGVGFDPSPLAKFGARELGLELRQDYFAEKNLALGPWDVAIATEVLEHLPHPPEFLRLMRQALKADGILVLTTPDAAFITPELPAGTLMPLLSPGAHIVLQTAQSLEVALRAAGFAHVQVRRDGLSLVAYASGTSFALNDDGAAGRSMYRTYLVERAALAALTSDLRLGYAGRGIFEAVNDGDWDAADAAWEALLPAAKTRFGLDLQSMSALPPGAAEASLAELCRMMPLGLGMILFGRAMRLLQAGQSRAQVEPVLRLAAEAVDALLRALAKHSLQDGLSASLAGLLRTELLMCAAAAGRPEVVTRLSALGDEETSWRCFVELVNAGEMSVATALREVLPELPSGQIPAVLTRDALLSLVNFHLAPGGDAMRVLPYVAALKAGGNNADAAILGAFTRLVNAQRFEDAKAMRAAEPILRKLDGLTDDVAEEPALGRSQPPFPASTRDALFAAGILFLQEKAAWQRSVGVFARLREAFVRSSPAGTVPDPLFWPALRGEVIALQRLNRGAEAVTLLQSFLDAYPGAPEDLREQAEGVKS